MALVVADRVQETTTTTGTGTITLAGAVAGFQSFAVIGNANTTYYCITSGNAWEVGIGTYTAAGTTLARTTVLASSASGAAITLAGTSNVFCVYPAGKSFGTDQVLAIANGGSGTNTATGTGNLVLATGPVISKLDLAAGVAAAGGAPLQFTSGTNLTTAEAGAVEYDGRVAFFSPVASQRGLLMSPQYYRLNAGNTGTAATGGQSIFGVGCSLSSGTVYEFEMMVPMSKSAGTTNHAIALLFGGTAVIGAITYTAFCNVLTSAFATVGITASLFSFVTIQATTSTSITGGLTNASIFANILVKGTVTCTTAGTFIPQYAQTVNSGGAYTVAAGSYIKIYPIGATGANTSIGSWA